MPYNLDMKKRSLYAPEWLWKKFRAVCDRKKCQTNATMLSLLEAVADGRIKLKRPKVPGLRFRLDEEIVREGLELTPEAERFREDRA